MGKKTRRIAELEEAVRERDERLARQWDALSEIRGALSRRGLDELDGMELPAAVEKALADLDAAGGAGAVKIGELAREIKGLRAKLADTTACNERQALKLEEAQAEVERLRRFEEVRAGESDWWGGERAGGR